MRPAHDQLGGPLQSTYGWYVHICEYLGYGADQNTLTAADPITDDYIIVKLDPSERRNNLAIT